MKVRDLMEFLATLDHDAEVVRWDGRQCCLTIMDLDDVQQASNVRAWGNLPDRREELVSAVVFE